MSDEKSTRLAQKQKKVMHKLGDKNESIEKDQEMTEMMEFMDKDFQAL